MVLSEEGIVAAAKKVDENARIYDDPNPVRIRVHGNGFYIETTIHDDKHMVPSYMQKAKAEDGRYIYREARVFGDILDCAVDDPIWHREADLYIKRFAEEGKEDGVFLHADRRFIMKCYDDSEIPTALGIVMKATTVFNEAAKKEHERVRNLLE